MCGVSSRGEEPPKPKPGSDEEKPLTPRGCAAPTLLALMLIFGTAQILMHSLAEDGSVPYAEFRGAVRDGRVASVVIEETSLSGEYRAAEGETAERFVTVRPPGVGDEALLELLESHDVEYRGQVPSAWTENWPSFIYIGLTVLLMLFLWRNVIGRFAGGPGAMMGGFAKSKGKLVQERDVDVTFDHVAGADEAKEELREIIDYLQNPSKYHRLGARIPKGVLLVGPPGTGKTLMARAVAGEAGVTFISISGSEFVEMFVGVGAARVRDLFQQAEKSAPCIVFIDELDALGKARSSGPMLGGNEERESTLNQLLVELDGFETREAVILLAATNRPEVLDPALLRAGRFDRHVVVDRPDRNGRAEILAVHTRKMVLSDDVELEVLAKRTPGFVGADLANLANEAALLAARRGGDAVAMQDFSEAIDRVVAGLEKRSRLMDEEERRRVAYHEVGHALCSVLAGSGERVHKISIVPRGVGALGYTIQMPDQEKYLMTEPEIRARLVGLVGGRAAEEVVFGEPSTGAQNDLMKATEIARAMVTEYGMSEAIGPVVVGGRSRPQFLQGMPGDAPVLGDRLADTVAREVREIVASSLTRAKQLLEANRDSLEKIAEELLEVEQLEGDHLEQLLSDAVK